MANFFPPFLSCESEVKRKKIMSLEQALYCDTIHIDFQKNFEMLDVYTAASLGDILFFTKHDVGKSTFKLSSPNLSGWTPLLYACSKGHSALVNYFLISGVSRNTKTQSGITPLMLAISSGDLSTVESIFDFSNLEDKDYKNWTPLFYAVHFSREKCVNYLLKKGAEVNIVDYQNETPIMAAIKSGRESMVELLLKKVTNLDVISFKQESALMLAKESNNLKILAMVENHSRILKKTKILEVSQNHMTPTKNICQQFSSTPSHCSPTPIKQQIKSQLSNMKIGKSLTYTPNKTPKSSQKNQISVNLNSSMKRLFPKKFWSPQLKHYNNVEQFLKNLGLEKYWPIFRDEEIDFEILLTLNEKNLKELGIMAFGPRKKILLAIQQLRNGY